MNAENPSSTSLFRTVFSRSATGAAMWKANCLEKSGALEVGTHWEAIAIVQMRGDSAWLRQWYGGWRK